MKERKSEKYEREEGGSVKIEQERGNEREIINGREDILKDGKSEKHEREDRDTKTGKTRT